MNMDIYKEILDNLKKEYEQSTYQEMAKKFGLSYTHMRNLMNGDRAFSGISLEVLFKLFPRATIHLYGDTVSSIVGNSNNGNNTVTVNAVDASAEIFRTKAVMATTDLDIPAENIVKIQKMLKDLK